MTEEVMASSRVNYMEGLKDGLNVIKHGERGLWIYKFQMGL